MSRQGQQASNSATAIREVEQLKMHGLRPTAARLKILEVIRNYGGHLSAEDIYRRLIADDSHIGLCSVYRVLGQLENAQIVKRNDFGSGRSVFKIFNGVEHDLLICSVCGRIEEFLDPNLKKRQLRIAKEKGFELAESQLTVYGLCEACFGNKRSAR